MYREIYTTASHLHTFSEDRRAPIEQLYSTFDQLSSVHGWKKHVMFNQVAVEPEHSARTHFPIVAYTTIKSGPALYLLAGVHGEEPAGPMAFAKEIEVLIELAKNGVPIVFLPLCNPKGYYRDERYVNARRNPEFGRSATEADHFMVHLEDKTISRTQEPASPESFAINTFLYTQFSNYPPLLEVDTHEDEADLIHHDGPLHERFSTYCYVISKLGHDDPIGRHVIKLLTASGIPFQTGWTRFGEWVERGVVVPEEGEGSIDEFLASEFCVINGVVQPKPAVRCSITTETPTYRGVEQFGKVTPTRIPISERVEAQGAVIKSLSYLWLLTQQNYL